MQENHFDVIVIGVGSMGSAACYQLAKSGLKVLGLEQFTVPHEKGSHGGQSRIIRKAYFEHPDYVPLLERAYNTWQELEAATGEKIYHETGLLYMGLPDNPLISGVRQSASLYSIPLESLTNAGLMQRYPVFKVPDEMEILFEPAAGLLLPEKIIPLYVTLSRQLGAEIHEEERIIDWQMEGRGVVVNTTIGLYRADKLVLSAGAWMGRLLPALNSQLTITRQVMGWITPKDPTAFSRQAFPCWTLAEPNGHSIFYGFPALDDIDANGPKGFKLAYHGHGEETNCDDTDRLPDAKDEQLLSDFIRQYMPGTAASTAALKTCRYTNTPDENFMLGHLPGTDGKVSIASCCSGHGFKFSAVVGEILRDLTLHGKTALPIGFLGVERLQ
jgi:sarcosine oxidase